RSACAWIPPSWSGSGRSASAPSKRRAEPRRFAARRPRSSPILGVLGGRPRSATPCVLLAGLASRPYPDSPPLGAPIPPARRGPRAPDGSGRASRPSGGRRYRSGGAAEKRLLHLGGPGPAPHGDPLRVAGDLHCAVAVGAIEGGPGVGQPSQG